MNNKNYQILIIIISLVVFLAIAGTFYFLSKQATVPESTTTATTTASGGGTGLFPASENITTDKEQAESTTQNIVPEITPTEQKIVFETGTVSADLKNTANIPTGGMTFIEKDRNGVKTTFVRYIEKGTGHISEIAFDENIPTKITNTTMIGVFSSFWNKDGSAVVIKRLDGINNDIETIYGQIESSGGATTTPEGGVGTLNKKILPSSVLEVSSSPLGDKLFYLVKSGDLTTGSISDFKGSDPFSSKINIWNSPISEWQINWPKQDQIMLSTKPAYNVSGFLYSLSVPKDNKFEKVLGNIVGLTANVNSSGKKIIYSESTGGGFMTYIFNKQDNSLRTFPAKTLPEKCIWSKMNENVIYCGVPKNIISSRYPDNWYKGTISFSDDIYRIDLDVNSKRKLIMSGQPDNLDAIELKLSPNEDYLTFINKRDSNIWTIKLK